MTKPLFSNPFFFLRLLSIIMACFFGHCLLHKKRKKADVTQKPKLTDGHMTDDEHAHNRANRASAGLQLKVHRAAKSASLLPHYWVRGHCQGNRNGDCIQQKCKLPNVRLDLSHPKWKWQVLLLGKELRSCAKLKFQSSDLPFTAGRYEAAQR